MANYVGLSTSYMYCALEYIKFYVKVDLTKYVTYVEILSR